VHRHDIGALHPDRTELEHGRSRYARGATVRRVAAAREAARTGRIPPSHGPRVSCTRVRGHRRGSRDVRGDVAGDDLELSVLVTQGPQVDTLAARLGVPREQLGAVFCRSDTFGVAFGRTRVCEMGGSAGRLLTPRSSWCLCARPQFGAGAFSGVPDCCFEHDARGLPHRPNTARGSRPGLGCLRGAAA